MAPVVRTARWRRLVAPSAAVFLPLGPSGAAAVAAAAGASESVAAKQAQLEEARAALRRAEAELAEALAESEGSSLQGGVSTARSAAVTTCNARIWSRDTASASSYLEKQHRLRAPYYIKSALSSYRAGMRQVRGEDKSNNDPFIKWHEGTQQILGALDLAPDDPAIWRDAGKATVTLAALNDEASDQVAIALSFFSQACRLQPSLLPEVLDWLEKEKSDTPAGKRARKSVLKTVRKWNDTGKVDDVPVRVFPSLTDGSCSLGGRGFAGHEGDPAPGDAVARALRGFQLRNLFPTRVVHKNVLADLPPGFAQRLSELCVKKYRDFAARFPGDDPNDLNDKFFGYQVTSADALQAPSSQKVWPELYRDSEDFKLLVDLLRGALKNFLPTTGVDPLPNDQDEHGVVLWAAVYPGNGGRHGYHVHQNSLSSCVIYLRTAGATTPITFVDPRGAPPVDDFEQHEKELDFEPVAPFHRSEYFFPEAGDLVCFPSWLVHNVPSHWEAQTRVAFAANYQAGKTWDSWHRTSAGWT